MKSFKIVAVVGLSLLALAGCAEEEFILPGEREDVVTDLDRATDASENKSAPIRLSSQVNHTVWSHRAGTATHSIQHPAFTGPASLVWSASIGQGNDRRHRITADPVAANGRIFTLDSRATVAATATNGAAVWSRDLTPSFDKPDDASGGGLAVVDGVLYVTTGFGQLFALNAATGETIWLKRLDGAATGAPTVSRGIVYIVTRNGTAWALDTSNGLIRWQLDSASSFTGVVGGSAPAVNNQIVVFPFSTTQITAAFRKDGFQVWNSAAAGDRVGSVYARISDITGDPVMRSGRTYVGNPSGRMISLDSENGDRLWTAGVGAVSTPWVDGGSVFVVSDLSEVVRLNENTGERIWSTQLPDYVPKKKVKRRRDFYVHFGPVLAGGQLWVASSDEKLRSFDPVDGTMTSVMELPDGASTRPIVVGGVMYVVNTKGQLLAFR